MDTSKLVLCLCLMVSSYLVGCDTDSLRSEEPNAPILGQLELAIYTPDRGLTEGYDIGVNSSEGLTNWLSDLGDHVRMDYPENQSWGSVFITVGTPTDPPRPSVNLSYYNILSIDLKGENGGEDIQIGIKDNLDPDDGTETKILVSDLTTEWQTYTFVVLDFVTANSEQLYIVTEFVFEGPTAQSVSFRNVKYKGKVYGLDFGPYIDDQDPNLGTQVTEQQLRDRMEIIAPYTGWIRTYGIIDGLENAGRIAHELGLKAAIGVWLSSDLSNNSLGMENLINVAKNGYVDLAIIGSETLFRGDLTEDQLVEYIEQFKNEVPSVPVTTADNYSWLLDNPKVMEVCDVILANYYPYWDGKDVEEALSHLHSVHKRVVYKANGKEVIVSETGWPSDGYQNGDAVPSEENACFYFLNFVSWARAEGVRFFYFEAFDEQWKATDEGSQGAHWGVWDKDGILKPCMRAVFYDKSMTNNWGCQDIPGGIGDPIVEFSYVPPYGSHDNLRGQVWHISPDDHAVAVYIKVGSGWWTKPSWNNPLSLIDCNGTWTCDITTGGIDSTARAIAAYLVPAFYDPPSASGRTSLPGELEEKSVAKVEITRSP